MHRIEDLAKAEIKDEILLITNMNTELHIVQKDDVTIVRFPFGNKFDVVNGEIHIKEIN